MISSNPKLNTGIGLHTRYLGEELIKRDVKLIVITTRFINQPEDYIPPYRLIEYSHPIIDKRMWYKIPDFSKFILKNLPDDVDIIHVQGSILRATPTLMALKKMQKNKGIKTPKIFTFHGPQIWEKHRYFKFLKPFYINIYSKFDKIITVNPYYDISKHPKIKPKSIFIPNGYRDDIFKPMPKEVARKTLNLDMNKIVITTVGAHNIKKATDFLIKSFSYFTKNYYDDSLLVIIGNGPLKNKNMHLSKKLGINDKVLFIPPLKSHKDIALWMNASDIYALTSISESWGIPQIEALACNKPIVATDTIGSRYIIYHSHGGFLVKKRDPYLFAKYLKKAAERDWDANSMISFASQFSWRKVAMKIINLYKDMINK